MIIPTKEKLLQSLILSSYNTSETLNILDATCGNGYDTFFLSNSFKNSLIYAIDIQEEAIKNTKVLCKEQNNIIYKTTPHEKFLKDTNIKFDFIIFNTGYLPKSSSSTMTTYQTTILALKYALKKLNINRFMTITLYKGHDDSEEFNHVSKFLKELNKYVYIVFSYQTYNTHNSPVLFIIEKKKEEDE